MSHCLTFGTLGILVGMLTRVAAVDGGVCSAISVGLDTTLARNSAGSAIGRSIGQSFFAPTRYLKSIAVWRVASQAQSVIGMDLHIFDTDSLGTPRMDREVLDGPTIVRNDGDGIHPTEFRWIFEPPLQLPEIGTYAFFLKQDPCLAYFDVISTGPNPTAYPNGHLWLSQRGPACALVPIPPESIPLADIIFNAEFCEDAVPVQRRSWGQVKTIYR